ncbi:hypothetical protein PABG_11172 [Paracoccidioides brasiliensis Pb03]|uniref:Uncharacterized protein n=1 Tax=Paracoccidioides brasiliensis (strain Pb18) TaxID=502780 RepID=C1G7I6_PARBD|nr:uncharacterized protein PADG_03141 [Paracoccidioides brasiliensis Pb18]EEH47043.2 hypothetical protein PADG_03141 [Paracoccidioides brasiliensis Pb18]KGY15924.1 hypothetical protein PABG_11172 [Paracoccidioides brasiliensis Pb03]ODH51477.1 hypothetical protein GX48_02343 [Paracoccidioides brasiliensis]
MSTTSGAGEGNNLSYKLPLPKDEKLLELAAKASRERREETKEIREKQQANRELMERAGRDSKERRQGGRSATT